MMIKDCPFCGGTAELQSTYNANYRYRKYFISVKCTVCGSTGKAYTSKENPSENDWNLPACQDAVELWNKRPYLNDDIMDLAVYLGKYILSKSHTDEVSQAADRRKEETDGEKRKDG